MKFKNTQGDTLELSPVSWEYPNDDWLMIRVKCKDQNGTWEGVDPSLTIQEARTLSNWIISDKSCPESTLDFLEPELEFRFVGGLLRIYLEFKYRPPWKPSDFDAEDNYYYLEFELSNEELRKESEVFKQELLEFSA